MKASIHDRLVELKERYEEVSHLLAEPEIIGDTDRFRELSREYARLDQSLSDGDEIAFIPPVAGG